MKARHAEIAGAGYAGLALAAALGRRGWTVRVHEQAGALRAFGAGIYIWENGLHVLRALGCHDRVAAGSHEAPYYRACGADGTTISRHAFGPQMGTRMLTMTRQLLYQALLDEALKVGAEFSVNSRIASAREEGALVGTDGKVFHADLVIGADGVGSAVRDSLGLTSFQKTCPDGAIRMLVPRLPSERENAEAADVEAYFAATGQRILSTPCDGENLYLAFITKTDDVARTEIPLNQAAWCKVFPALASLIGRATRGGRWDTYQVIKLSRWSAGRVAVLGDAAHSMPPTLGQGAGLALMNALSLAVALDETNDIEEALRHWETNERPLTEYTQNLSYSLLTTGGHLPSQDMSPWSDASLRTARHIPVGAKSAEHRPCA
jgi:2-polyprenyl-6-methoxyphenol hydroxylase-like FAD-dependent oxidoreductase